jgi:hypothetical protein
MIRRAFALTACVLACGPGASCAAEFLPASVVVNERVIAVTASPPEAVPGQEVTLTPVVVSPTGDLVDQQDFDVTWWRCPAGDSDALGDFAQCTVPADREDVGTGVPYVDTVPLDLFGDLTPPAEGEEPQGLPSDKLLGAILGYWRVVGMTMTSRADEPADKRTVEAFKRIPVYLPVRLGDVDPRFAQLDSHVNAEGELVGPNTNPTIAAVLLHEDKPNGAVVTTVSTGGTYFLQPLYDEDALEDYISLKVNFDGLDVSDPAKVANIPVEDLIARFEKVQRCEIPTFSWFVTHGRVRRDTTLDESVVERVFDPREVDCPPVEGEERAPEVEYTAPTGEEGDPLPEDGVIRGWVVMRDGRGGAAVRSFELAFE